MKDVFFFKGVCEFLEFLREKGIRMVVVIRSLRDVVLFVF